MPRKTGKSNKTLKQPAWQGHEILTTWIYKALLDQDQVKNVRIQHNVKVRGIKSSHQIDVYWKFRLAGVEYATIVQVKKEKRRVEKGEIHKLEGVLADLPGQPRGVFVTQAGYQKGALEHARRAGIDLIQLSEVANLPPISMTTLSQARMELQLDKLQMKVTVFNTSVQKVNISFDRVWATEAHFPLSPQFDSLNIESAVLANELGQPLPSLHERVQAFVRDHPAGGELLIEFTEPTYLIGFKLTEPTDCRVDRLRLLKILLQIHVDQIVQYRPLSTKQFVTYVLERVIEDEQRYVMVGVGTENPQVILSFQQPARPPVQK